MKRFMVIVFSASYLYLSPSLAYALSLYVDAAPNVYGSPDYPTWQTETYGAVAAGEFQNMANGVNNSNIGTTNFEIQDEVVYSFGDLGKRLTWIYWIPGETVASLDGRFEISLFNTWGEDDPLDFYNDYYGSTWLQPTSWTDYEGGVIGMAGMAWWGAYGENTPESLAADIAEWEKVSESWIFSAKLDGVETSITSNRAAVAPVLEPSPLVLLAGGLCGLAWFRLRNKKGKSNDKI